LRLLLPVKILDYNGVKVANSRIFDNIIPGVEGSALDYESALVSALKEEVEPSDTVFIVGGG
jgi:hypothetical protein